MTNAMTTEQANKIVTKYSAFRSVEELAAAMLRGYVPTVSRRRQRPLLRLLVESNLKVFEVP